MRLKVDYEWDALREVVVGCPRIRLGTRIPRYVANFMPPAAVALAEEVLEAKAGQSLAQAMPELHELAATQMDRAIAILRDRGVVVHQVAPFQPHEEAYLAELGYGNNQQYFPRDPIVVIGDTLVETAMYCPMRRGERFSIRRTLAERLRGCRVASLPEPAPLPEDKNGAFGPGPFLEGGDVFVLGPDIYVGNSGNASNSAGIGHLRHILGEAYRVHEVRLSGKFLHLDCILSTPRPGLAVVCSEGFVDGLPGFLKDWELIEISAKDAEERLATNMLVLDRKTVLIAEELPELAEALTRAGQEVITTPFSAVFMWGGAFRCWHHPLIREDQ
jgi:N-dimethylarginine dimethylaminohydrolase